MKKLLIVIALFLLSYVAVNAQTNLYCADYAGTGIRDTLAVAGSTNAGSGWFTNKGFKTIEVLAHNGTDWFSFTVDYDCSSVTKFKVMHYGADSTLGVYGFMGGSQSILLPIKNGYKATNTYKFDAIDLVGVVTAQWFIQIRGKD